MKFQLHIKFILYLVCCTLYNTFSHFPPGRVSRFSSYNSCMCGVSNTIYSICNMIKIFSPFSSKLCLLNRRLILTRIRTYFQKNRLKQNIAQTIVNECRDLFSICIKLVLLKVTNLIQHKVYPFLQFPTLLSIQSNKQLKR